MADDPTRLTDNERRTHTLLRKRIAEEMKQATDGTNGATMATMGRLHAKHRELETMIAYLFKRFDELRKQVADLETCIELLASGQGNGTVTYSHIKEMRSRLARLERYLKLP
jgi:hypothetical protein